MAEVVKKVFAAGTVTLRSTDSGPQVLMVHRPRYDDWSLPKGKLEPEEYLPGCAVRETAEESSVEARLGMPVGELIYPVGSGVKAVTYWLGHPVEAYRHKANHEVDQIGWFSVTNALRKSSYPDERELIRQAVNLPATTALVILRHAKAMARSDWSHRDQDRPLSGRGQRQSSALIPLLDAYGTQRLVSSSARRCTATLRPFAEANGLAVEGWSALTEETAAKDPDAAVKLMRSLALETATSGRASVVCGHRPVLPSMLAAIGLDEPALQPGAALVAHLGLDAAVVALELHKPNI